MSAGRDGAPPIPAGSRYVAMGSSFATGPGITPRVAASPRRAGRSSRNYAHLVAGALGLDLYDVTYSGATTGDILPWPLPALPRLKARVAEYGDLDATEERFARLAENLAAIAARLHGRAPACRVLFVDYLTILPPRDDDRGGPPPSDIAAWGRAIAARLAATTRAAAQTAGYEYVAASAPRPITTPGRRPRGRGGSTCRCAAARRITRTRPGWRPWPTSCSRPWTGPGPNRHLSLPGPPA